MMKRAVVGDIGQEWNQSVINGVPCAPRKPKFYVTSGRRNEESCE